VADQGPVALSASGVANAFVASRRSAKERDEYVAAYAVASVIADAETHLFSSRPEEDPHL
jgi:hypothetical protein